MWKWLKSLWALATSDCPECGKRRGSTKNCEYCIQHRADMRDFSL